MKKTKILYLIVDLKDGDEKVREALKEGVDFVQLREKNVSSAKYLSDALHMRRLVDECNEKYGHDTLLVINDRLDVALLSKADGVHLGKDDIPVDVARKYVGRDFIIGATAKTVEAAIKAEKDGADYLGTGAFFSTTTKMDATEISDETYSEILKSISIPDVAIGGITTENCKRPLELGANGLAVLAGIMKQPHPGQCVKTFKNILKEF